MVVSLKSLFCGFVFFLTTVCGPFCTAQEHAAKTSDFESRRAKLEYRIALAELQLIEKQHHDDEADVQQVAIARMKVELAKLGLERLGLQPSADSVNAIPSAPPESKPPSSIEGIEEQGKRVLCVMDADGQGTPHVLIRNPSGVVPDVQGSPDWSADGQRIAFDGWLEAQGEANVDAHIYVVNADGTNFRDLGPGAMPNWSPKGHRLAFSSYNPSGVFAMDVDGKKPEFIGDGWCAQWSPDGKTIAYTLGNRFCLYDVIEKQRTYATPVHPNLSLSYIEWNYCWSPDSKRLMFRARMSTGDYAAGVIDVSNKAASTKWFPEVTEMSSERHFDWNPHHNRVLFAAPTGEPKVNRLHTISLGRRKINLVPGQREQIDALYGNYSPCGKKIVFAGYVTPPGDSQ